MLNNQIKLYIIGLNINRLGLLELNLTTQMTKHKAELEINYKINDI